jgi:4-methylaminobutanoate oxidase (formaldehyde-forming)
MNDELVGAITTGSYGHSLGAPVGLGWISLPASVAVEALAGQRFEVLVAGQKIEAEVSRAPMYDPENQRIRS